jgi:hypothetical protein
MDSNSWNQNCFRNGFIATLRKQSRPFANSHDFSPNFNSIFHKENCFSYSYELELFRKGFGMGTVYDFGIRKPTHSKRVYIYGSTFKYVKLLTMAPH